MRSRNRKWADDEKTFKSKKDGSTKRAVPGKEKSGNFQNSLEEGHDTNYKRKIINAKVKSAKDECDEENVADYKRFPEKLILMWALSFGLINILHVSTMFENDRHFSHLSNLEREMTFRTEMGLYYSYYKTLVEADSFSHGINHLMFDNLTEYPDTINTLERFNLLPELVLGASYRIFKNVISHFGMEMQICWQIHRGNALSPVVSCEGIGDPVYWYLYGVWICAGLTAALIFLYGVKLSKSLIGGFIAILCFFFNHSEATRVQWTPPLRENFAFPFCLALNMIVTTIVRKSSNDFKLVLSFSILSGLYILCWQFAQFTMFITIAGVYIMYVFHIIPAFPMLIVICASLGGYINSVILQFGNVMLLSSLLGGCLLGVVLLYVFIEPLFQYFPSPTNMAMQISFFFISTAACKIELSRILSVEEDSHIFNIFRSKFTNFSDFHTLLYTCSPEFDFMSQESFYKMSATLLIPLVTFICGAFAVHTLLCIKQNMQASFSEERKKLISVWQGVDPGIIYNMVLLIVYGFLALLVMRLKVFFTPQLCIIASLLATKKFLPNIKKREIYNSLLALIVGCMFFGGVKNILEQRSIVGEYYDPQLEELIQWVQEATPKDAVFAGPMPIMANLLLSTRRPIVNHPHYEHALLRERTKKVYSIFSRRSPEKVYEILLSMKVNYVVIAEPWCFRKSKPGCGMIDLWDKEEPHMLRHSALCPQLFHNTPPPFHKVYSNEEYVVLQVPSKYVQIPAPKAHSS